MLYPVAPARTLQRAAAIAGLAFACGVLMSAAAPRARTPATPRSPVRNAAAADTDDFGAPLPTDARFAKRVVSLNPAATEVIFAIGADSLLVGRSAWDEYPAAAKNVPSVGDGIRPNVEAVVKAKPTLVVLYASAENRAAAQTLNALGIRTLTLRVDHIAQFVSLTTRLGVALNASARARIVVDSVQRTLSAVRAVTRTAQRPRVVWPVAERPVMVVGRGSFLDELIEIAGGTNAFHDLIAPSPIVSLEEVVRRRPDVIIASPHTQESLKSRAEWLAVPAVRDGRFATDDPAFTGRPSVVLGTGAVVLARALHPELASQLPPLPAAETRARPRSPRADRAPRTDRTP